MTELEQLKKMIKATKNELSVMERVALLSLFFYRIGIFNILEAGLVDTMKDLDEERKQLLDAALVGIREMKGTLEVMRDVMGLDEDKPEPVLPKHIN